MRKLRRIRIQVPAGIDDGHSLRLRGEGEVGAAGTPPGDLYVVVNIPEHPVFKRREEDIYIEAKINAIDAILGAEIKIPTLFGDVKLEVPPGTQPSSSFKLKGKGLRRVNSFGKGDQYVIMNVYVPKSLSNKQKDLLKEVTREGKVQ